MNRMSLDARVKVAHCLVEGNSIRSTSRITGRAKGTVLKLLVDQGQACQAYMDEAFMNLRIAQIQADEVWSFCGCKEKNVPEGRKGEMGLGDCWTWISSDPDSKAVINWFSGKRDALCAYIFMGDLAKRLISRPQINTDACRLYAPAIKWAFEDGADYGILEKQFGKVKGSNVIQCTGFKRKVGQGNPDMGQVGTSDVERKNGDLRTFVRRMTRDTSGYSKKIENHDAALALHFFHANYCRKHPKHKGMTPAMALGVTDHVWTLAEMVELAS